MYNTRSFFTKNVLARILALVFILNLIMLPISATSLERENEDQATADLVASILDDLENGLAIETIQEYDTTSLSPSVLSNDPILADYISSSLSNFPQPNSTFTRYSHGKTYYDSITDASGNNLRYYLTPHIKWEYKDVPSYGDSSWTSTLYITEEIYLNGEKLPTDHYINRINIKNVRGYMGSGWEAGFTGHIIASGTLEDSSVDIDLVAIAATLLSPVKVSLSTILGILSSISFNTNTSPSEIECSNDNMIGVNFGSRVVLRNDGEEIYFSADIATKDSASEENVDLPCATLWKYDVYFGSSKETSAQLDITQEVLVNATK